jgi:hypothetical protein
MYGLELFLMPHELELLARGILDRLLDVRSQTVGPTVEHTNLCVCLQ